MATFSRRIVPLFIATALIGSLAAEPAFAQATVGPAGGSASSTAPSNSSGTPSGGTGVIGTTRVGPAVATPTRRYRPAARRTTPAAPVAAPTH